MHDEIGHGMGYCETSQDRMEQRPALYLHCQGQGCRPGSVHR
ncbi:hypothetical protein RR42_s0295 [Cupriavidus basilensis]|uniref:Uncharacterized protein n=1 Tax=Cupriavidus basilensis TaxID=68895 RepID=A0A0C4YMT4_9BURK|nr:hypothetical protein RR42_s0295 [Cupriavidus basilensis]